MLTCCGCIANKEQTEIITPCVLHELWRRQLERERDTRQADQPAGKEQPR